MDSINRQQPEENHKDMQGAEAGKKIKELAEKNNTCFFCTGIATGKPVTVRPMSVQKVDESGNFSLDNLRPGDYSLSFRMPDREVVVESLRL